MAADYRYDEDALKHAAVAAKAPDLNACLHELDVHPLLDETAVSIADATAAVVIQQSAGVITALMHAIAEGGEEGADITPGLENIGEQVKQACAAAFLRGVLLGHALRDGEQDG